MIAYLLTVRAELAVASRYPTTEGRLLRAIITAIDAYLAYRKWIAVQDHVAAVNGREGRRA